MDRNNKKKMFCCTILIMGSMRRGLLVVVLVLYYYCGGTDLSAPFFYHSCVKCRTVSLLSAAVAVAAAANTTTTTAGCSNSSSCVFWWLFFMIFFHQPIDNSPTSQPAKYTTHGTHTAGNFNRELRAFSPIYYYFFLCPIFLFLRFPSIGFPTSNLWVILAHCVRFFLHVFLFISIRYDNAPWYRGPHLLSPSIKKLRKLLQYSHFNRFDLI